jgi:hypothetical protein
VVFSDDPETPRFNLALEGEVIVDVLMKPRRLSFGSLRRGETATKEFTLKVRDPNEIQIESVSIEDDRFKLTKKDESDDVGSTYAVEFVGSNVYARIRAKVHVVVTGTKAKDHFLHMNLSVDSDLRFPARVHFSDRKGSFRPRHITLSSRSGNPVEILDFEDRDGLLSCEIAANKEARAKLLCKVNEGKVPEEEREGHKLTVSTTDKERPKVEIEYFVRRKPAKLHTRDRTSKRATLVPVKKEP